jgi:glycoside/pentoside/hexuronide:cation symporter, GPH family
MTDSVKAVASALYMLFLYTTVLALPARLVGLAAALSLVWDSIIDPVIGRLSDGTRGRFGRRHGWMLAGAVGTAVGFVALFSPPQGLPTWGLFVWLLLTWLLLRTSHSMFTVPYLALGAELSTDYDGRTRLVGYRAVAAQVGAIMASGLALAVFFSGNGGTDSRLEAASYANMAIALGCAIAVAGVVAVAGTWRYRAYHPAASHVTPAASRQSASR